MRTYLIIDKSDKYELPVGVFDSLRDVARYLNVAEGTARNALHLKTLVHKKYEILRIS